MTIALNTVSPTTYTTSVLIGDVINSSNSAPTMTTIGSPPVVVSACLELQSTLGAFLLPRMTSTQISAMPNLVSGMMVFNSTLGQYQTYNATTSVWDSFSLSDSNGNLYIGTPAGLSNGDNALVITNGGVAPSAGIANAIQLYSVAITTGNTSLAMYTQGTPISVTTLTTPDHSLAIQVNGTTYYLPCKLTNN